MKLRDLRKELGVNQLQIAAKAGVSISAVCNAENTETKSRYATLKKILKAINAMRVEQGLAPISEKEMEWNIS